MKIVLVIIWLFLKVSLNRHLALEVEKMIGKQADVTYLDYSDVPLINQDIEFPEPEAVGRLRATVKEADGIWVFTPEYNFSYPGHVKNLFDWLSRPLVAGDYETPTVINGKKVALTGAGGKMATAKCREKLTELLTLLKADVMEQQTGIVLNLEAWTEGRMILTEEQIASLKTQADAFLKFIG